ncbi:MAG: hypothetical protein IJ187_00985 [Neisseriaceae bacterium]|nr:hypothetical protein [Neisseriaceae bacterium]MBQ9725235.1 hypothetical protein [Neisseriaceae bacterium]
MKHFDPLQELDTSPDSEFVRAVNFVAAQPVDNKLAFEQVILGYTPLVLRLCDIGVGKMRIDYATIEKVIAEYLGRPKRDGFNTHNLTPEQLKQIPTQICNPIAIIQSQTRLNSVVVLTELFETKIKTGKTESTIVAVHFRNRKNDTWLKIQSIHGRTDEFLVDNLSGNLLLYLNREKCRQLMINHFTPERLRNLHKENHRNERLQIIAEMCGLEMHKGRYQMKTFASIAGGNDLLQTENDHLYGSNNTQKPNILQAVKQKISPKPKRTIPTPTGYKTEEDLKAFREETQKRPLTLGEAQAVGKRMLHIATPPDSPNFADNLQQLNDCLAGIYQNGKAVSRNDIERTIQQQADKALDTKIREKFYQANNQQQSVQQTQNPPEQSKDKGGRER